MDEKQMDDYLRAYGTETDLNPSDRLMAKIHTLPESGATDKFLYRSSVLDKVRDHLWRWVGSLMPKAVGWVLTCCTGVYFGLISPDQSIKYADDSFYMYDQTQYLLSEDILSEDPSIEDNDP